ncbi:MAG: hypothetical protein WKG06_00210 [Segetibacter sp.]
MELNVFKEQLWNLASDESISIYEIETFLRNFFKQKPLPLVTIAYENYCRCSLNNKNEIFNTVGRCSYNPFVNNIELQRCNYESQQVFYAAVPTQAQIKCTGTSIMEVTWEHISNYFLDYYFVTLSRWITKRPLKVFFFPDLQNQEIISEGVDIERDMMETEGMRKEDIPYYLSILKYFREVFGAKDSKGIWYRISAAFYNCIMRFGREENQNIDGMVYSSANTGKVGSNIVLNKELIDTGMLYCDYVQMWIARRNSTNPTDIWFFPVSDGVIPKPDGRFNIVIHPEFIEHFKNAPPLDISSIV